MSDPPRSLERTYLIPTLSTTLSASSIWGIFVDDRTLAEATFTVD
mgnify:CR=1 FL=1